MANGGKLQVLFSAPFRPFFLLAAVHAVAVILAWSAFLQHGWLTPAFLPDPFLWHAHGMVSGFAGAIIAGFLLTAAANWTGRPTTTPLTLALLVALWLTARSIDLLPTPAPLAGLVTDAAFWLLLETLLLRVIISSNNWRNLGFGLLPLAFGLADLAWHIDHAGLFPGIARPAMWIAVDLLIVIMGAMGGRIIPFFTSRRLPQARVNNPAVLAVTGNVLLAAVLVVNFFFRGETPAAAVMLVAGLLLLARLAGWNSFATRREPMLWILHLGYAWLGAALLLRAASILTGTFLEATTLHAVTVGALGALGLGMIARVALGHTGRVIASDGLLTVAFILVSLAGFARLSGLAGAPGTLAHGVSSVLWALAFALYLWRFTPILFAPRAS